MAARSRGRKRPAAERCRGKTRTGRRCLRKRAQGSEFCPQHREGGVAGGRPTKLTETVADLIVDALRAGGLKEHVAAKVGISRPTLYAWLERGDESRDGFDPVADEPYRVFRERAEQAQAAAILEAVHDVREAGKKDWRASAWYLERAAPDTFAGRRTSSAQALIRTPSAGSQKPEASSPPQLRVVDDLVSADGRAL